MEIVKPDGTINKKTYIVLGLILAVLFFSQKATDVRTS
jgi:hypothetical protein